MIHTVWLIIVWKKIRATLISGDSQSLLNGLGFAVDHPQIGARRPVGNASTLLPVAQRVDVEVEAIGKLSLRHSQTAADRLYVDLGRNVDDVRAFLGCSLGEGKRLFKATEDALANLAHDADLR